MRAQLETFYKDRWNGIQRTGHIAQTANVMCSFALRSHIKGMPNISSVAPKRVQDARRLSVETASESCTAENDTQQTLELMKEQR